MAAKTRGETGRRAKDKILGHLQGHNFKMMSFERVREKLNNSYTDVFLLSVINADPRDLRLARLKGGNLGVARLVEEEKGDENEG